MDIVNAMRSFLPLSIICMMLCLTCGALGAGTPPGTAQVVWYHSPVDGSEQAYGVYVPAVTAPLGGYPAVFHAHGYGWSVSTGFSDWQRAWADSHRWVLINLNARGPQFYEGIGEVATLEVVADATRRFGLDPDRLYITGASMGGTAALRHGVRHPYTFAAAAGVDGWSDYRLWHHHWYARADMRDCIEEFRRPLLQEASPLYWAERGQWGAVKTIVDGRDTTVWPENGLQLFRALLDFQAADRSFDGELALNYDKGHGGGYDLRAIYDFFNGRRRVSAPTRFHNRTYLLKHGQMYWGRIDRMRMFGLPATLASSVRAQTLSVRTGNVDRFTLQLGAAPVAPDELVDVYADGLYCYAGPPGEVCFEALRDCTGALVEWVQVAPAAEPVAQKNPDIAGPIGDVLTRPFTVAYGTAGRAAMTALHRREAQAFCDGWRAFMVRRGAAPDAIGPYPEGELPPGAMSTRSLVLFGTLETSSLLHKADSAASLPVIVGEDYVRVRDPRYGDRTWYGSEFGSFVCTPNPLCDGRHHLLVAKGQFATKADGTGLQGLQYDMEKLPWGYPDYVVFNTDQTQLPHVLNVNNKPEVTCYEAAYFVEHGYFDDRWHVRRELDLDRALDDKPEGLGFVHVDEVRAAADGAEARVVDAAGKPVRDARVTLTWERARYSRTGLTGEDGWVRLVGPRTPAPGPVTLTSVSATGAVHDFRADLATGSDGGALRIALAPRTAGLDASRLCRHSIAVTAHNRGSVPLAVSLTPNAPIGRWEPGSVEFSLGVGAKTTVNLQWYPTDDAVVPSGEYQLRLNARYATPDGRPGHAAALTYSHVSRCGKEPLSIGEATVADAPVDGPVTVSVTVRNSAEAQAQATVRCSIIPAGARVAGDDEYHYLEPKGVTVPGLSQVTVPWTLDASRDRLPIGMYEAVISSPGRPELTARVPFSVVDRP